jgi:hypothetical protein
LIADSTSKRSRGKSGADPAASRGRSVGYLTGDGAGIPRDQVESMKQSLTPDSSALVNARAVIANQIASR